MTGNERAREILQVAGELAEAMANLKDAYQVADAKTRKAIGLLMGLAADELEPLPVPPAEDAQALLKAGL